MIRTPPGGMNKKVDETEINPGTDGDTVSMCSQKVSKVIRSLVKSRGDGEENSQILSSHSRSTTPIRNEAGSIGDKLVSSPPRTRYATPMRSENPTKSDLAYPAEAEVPITPSLADTETPKLQLSPREELISKARAEEEQNLLRCRTVLSKMRLAMSRQKNISMEIKKGVSELDELLDVISYHRRSWKTAEIEKKERESMRILAGKKEQATSAGKNQTPISNKRTASSPAQDVEVKKHKSLLREKGWQTVTNRRQRNRTEKTRNVENTVTTKKQVVAKKKLRSEAMLINPKEGHTYADVLQNLRSKVRTEDTDVNIKTIRKTLNGAILLELEKGEKINSKLSDAIKSTVSDTADMRTLIPRTAIEIRDLDLYTTSEEVAGAIRTILRNPSEELKIHISAPNFREQKRALVNVSTENADILLKNDKIKIGWVNCRMRLYSGIRRCYRCLCLGHAQWECKGPDRRNQCIKCGKTDHKIKDCLNEPSCCLCIAKGLTEVEHILGSKRCSASGNQNI